MSLSNRLVVPALLAVAGAAVFCRPALAQPPVPPAELPPTPAPTTPPATAPATPPPATTDQSVPPEDAPRPRERFRIGPELGLYFLNDAKARDAFGDTIFNVGIGLGAVHYAKQSGEFNFDLNFISYNRSRNRIFMAPAGVGYSRSLVKVTGPHQVVPYAGVSANVFFVDLRSEDYNVGGGVRVGYGGSGFVGLNFGQSAYLQARYYGFSRVAGFQLSGTNLSLGYRF